MSSISRKRNIYLTKEYVNILVRYITAKIIRRDGIGCTLLECLLLSSTSKIPHQYWHCLFQSVLWTLELPLNMCATKV